MPMKTSQPLQSLCERGKLALAQGCAPETESVLLLASCVAEAGRGSAGREGELAALRNDVSSLVWIRDLVPMQLCVCSQAGIGTV